MAITVLFFAVLILCTALVVRALVKNRNTVLNTVVSASCGIATLAAVNLLTGATGIALAINYITCFIAVVLSVPGVLLMVALQFMMI